MEARHLRYALALAEHQHFGRAAKAVGIAQPPLSKQIAQLEGEVDARLFDRTARGVFPTAAGEAFLARARRALAEMEAAAGDAERAARGETGRLRLGFVGSALLELLPSVLNRFSRDHPHVRLQAAEMSTARGGRALLDGELDVCVGRGAPRGPGAREIVTVAVGRDRLVAVVGAAHPYAGQAAVSVGQLREQHLITASAEEEPATFARLRQAGGDGVFTHRGWTGARDVHTIMGLAACGLGVGLGPASMRAARRPDTWICDVTPGVVLPDLVMSFRADDASPVLAAFLAVTRDLCPHVGAALG
ncbi:LysR family transcriptional regulator [Streptomyces sp. SL13]|uniref:LysR family transcriptional regulator n=1 Tax=Streptantibioticus silvisoli TaxID=2705255 RepID=A0AA90H2Z1_9ACTN|nr:LysR family transcriptional regulator [Streptantibioticus silvisoli]MDI5972459.1 LysR family transcriptional regulator [Streptantibioticus silvisoli]